MNFASIEEGVFSQGEVDVASLRQQTRGLVRVMRAPAHVSGPTVDLRRRSCTLALWRLDALRSRLPALVRWRGRAPGLRDHALVGLTVVPQVQAAHVLQAAIARAPHLQGIDGTCGGSRGDARQLP